MSRLGAASGTHTALERGKEIMNTDIYTYIWFTVGQVSVSDPDKHSLYLTGPDILVGQIKI